MATRFTRLSVVADQQQLDASLPASRPVAEFLGELSALFNLPTTSPPTTWTLSTPRHGVIAAERSLDEAGVLDGDVLYLSRALAAAEAPVVDDVLAALSDTVNSRARPWSGPHRDRVVTTLLALAVLALIAVVATVPDPYLGGAILLIVFGMGSALVRPLSSRGGQILGWATLPAAVLGGFGLTAGAPPSARLTTAAAAGLAAVAIVAAVGRQNRTLVTAGVASGGLAAGVAVLLAVGVDGTSVAAWATPAFVLALGVLPQLALSASGLLGLVERCEQGQSTPRSELNRAMRVGRSVVDGGVAAVALAGAVAAGTLVWAGRPAQAALGVLLGVLFLLRSRGFSHAHHVAALLAVPVVTLLAVAVAAPSWAGLQDPAATALPIVAVALVAATVTAAGYLRVSEVNAARLSRLFDRVDTVAVVVVVPMVLLAQDVFGWLAQHL
jgi:type VII secretion integral membrane protein EccD